MELTIPDEEITLDEEDDGLEVDGRSLSEGTISPLLAASQFDVQGFFLPTNEFQTASGDAFANAQTDSKAGITNSYQFDPPVEEDEGSNRGNLVSSSDEALNKAIGEVVRTLKRGRESLPASRNVSQEDGSTVEDFISQVEINESRLAANAATDTAAGKNESSLREFLSPSEVLLKPHLENIQIRVEPDPFGSWCVIECRYNKETHLKHLIENCNSEQ